jgi:cellulose synthase/poly-beta-1,6-N-acetylglucosamine synthase-like glycosyltransferase
MTHWMYLVAAIYAAAALGLFLHGVNAYVLVFSFVRNKTLQTTADALFRDTFWDTVEPAELPRVTVQVPIYNERYVIERQIDALAKLNYPRDLYEVQILDDSTDDTVDLVAKLAEKYRAEGVDVKHIRRDHRVGFKAGALAYGTEIAKGELLAIFDADFVPQPDFLRRTVPFFDDTGIGLVQTRWGHINEKESFLTLAQSIGIDGHFSVEQAGRAWSSYFLNFNGTAGVWRKTAIQDAGGWQADTLTEDLDLSYRAQFRGWGVKYLFDTVTPAEIPSDINSFKSQQFRWAKGSIQSAKKNIPRLLTCDVPWWTKYQAIIHMTHYIVHPLMVVVALLSIPMLTWFPMVFSPLVWTGLATLLLISTFGPSMLYTVSQQALYHSWYKRILILPGLVCLGTGIAINNTRAVFEALFGIESGFVRTPKSGFGGGCALDSGSHLVTTEQPAGTVSVASSRYSMPLTWTFAIEVILGLYCIIGVWVYIHAHKFLIGPFLLIYGVGFLFVAWLSVMHVVRSSGRLHVAKDFVD